MPESSLQGCARSATAIGELRPKEASMRRLILTACMIAPCWSSASAADPTGEWRVAKGYAHIRIANCNGALWGVISWEQQPGGRDSQNPDPALRNRPILGSPILLDMKPKGDRWEGQI